MDAFPTIPSPDATENVPGTSRRSFLQHVASAGALVAGTALTSACAGATTVAGAAGAPGTAGNPQWDMSWRNKLQRYRTAYDSPEIVGGAALAFAAAAVSGYRDALQAERDFTPVLILRHAASVMVLDDEMWRRIGIGESRKVNDPTTKQPAVRNPFLGPKSPMGADGALDALMQNGAIVLTCNRALMGVAYQLRQKETQYTQATAHEEVRRHVLPGVYVMPNGIFAVAAAQDAGCNYMIVPA